MGKYDLYTKHLPALKSFANLYAHRFGLSSDDVFSTFNEKFVRSTFVDLDYKNKTPEASSFIAWCKCIFNSICVDASRRWQDKVPHLSILPGDDQGNDIFDFIKPEGATGVLKKSNEELLDLVINSNHPTLTDEDHLLILFLYQGYKYTEMAQILSLNLNTVKAHVRNLRSKLTKIYGKRQYR